MGEPPPPPNPSPEPRHKSAMQLEFEGIMERSRAEMQAEPHDARHNASNLPGLDSDELPSRPSSARAPPNGEGRRGPGGGI